jgi:hypothetical protein
LSKAKAVALFDLMEKFAGYGFNKSHSAAYALIAYQTAWLKVHHPAAFMAANLSLVMDDTDKVRALRDDALALGLEVLPPDVNASTWRFEPVDPKRIRYGLGGIKGTGQQAVEAIVAAREAGGPFRDLADFAARVDKRLVNRRVIEALVKGGAFDAIDKRRATLFASIGNALAEAERAQAQAAQNSLFGDAAPRPRTCWSRRATGATPSGCSTRRRARLLPVGPPVRRLRGRARAARAHVARRHPAARRALPDRRHRHRAARAVRPPRQGRVRHARRRQGLAEIVVFNEVYDASRAMLREDALVVVEVKATTRMTDDGEAQGMRILAEQVYDLAAVRKRWGKRLKLSCNGNASAEHLADILAPFRAEGCRSSCTTTAAASRATSSCPTRGASRPTTRSSRGSPTGSRRRTCRSCTEAPARRFLTRPTIAARYRALFAHPGALRFVALSLVMRLPTGTLGLATLLHLRELTGSIAFAGAAVGAQLVAMAAMAPALGRIIDRRGPRGVLAITGIACPVAVATMLAAGPLGLSRSAMLAAAIAVGATAPPLASLIRTLWRMRLDDTDVRRTAFAVDAVVVETRSRSGRC